MADRIARSPDRSTLLIGAIAAAFGLYLCLVGFGLLPEPSRRNGPLWLGAAAGIAFLFAGLSVMVRGLIGLKDNESELPEEAPLWAKALYWFAGVAAAGSLSMVGTWVAFGGGDRHFNMTGLIAGPLNEGIGRALFGLGTIIAWFITIALAQHGARKIFGKKS
jgi:hypothetical protein